MALIKCPECGKEISDAAESCPNCGYPIKGQQKMKKEVMSFAVVVKGGIVQQIGKGVVSRPETCFSGQPTKWAKDIYKKGHGPVPEVE